MFTWRERRKWPQNLQLDEVSLRVEAPELGQRLGNRVLQP